MKNLFKHFVQGTLAVIMTMSVMAAPVMAIAYAAAPNQPIVTTKSYDMDEYLNMLVSTEQWEKYDKIVKIANSESLQKHFAWYQEWSNVGVYDQNNDPMAVVMAQANFYGFHVETDQFKLIRQNNDSAWVRVVNGSETAYFVLQQSNGYWHVIKIYYVK